MSKYTTEVRFLCEQAAGLTESAGYDRIDNILDSARDKIFDFDFPLFDENYRVTLENKILKHYYTREIGAESIGLWKHWLCTRMNEIMPYYNELYKSAVIEFNPMYDVDLTTDYQKVDNGNRDKTGSYSETNEGERNSNGTSTRTENATINTSVNGNTDTTVNDAKKNDHWEYFSDTPEGGINGVADLSYLTNATHITDDGTGTTSTTNSENTTTTETTNETTNNGATTDTTTNTDEKVGSNSSNEVIRNTEDYLHHVIGKTGGISYSKLLKEYRDTFINIDMMIIRDLRDLFMNVW